MSVSRMVRLALILGLAARMAHGQGDVAGSPHNLSVSGPGALRAATESEICIFCHATHNTNPQAPLWNRRDPGGTYTTYKSSSLRVAPGQPSGASRLCLSCHDGTIALGSVLSRPGEIAMAGPHTMPAGRTRIGLDLSDDHPVSFDYAGSLAARGALLRLGPSAGGDSMLDAQGRIQCTSCHDPHDNTLGDFLRVSLRNAALCTTCHVQPGWQHSSHATSTRTWDGAGRDPWVGSPYRTVAENGCGSCHTSHAAQGRQRLLKSVFEEDVCLACHSGSTAGKNIAAEMSKWRAHDGTATRGVHDPTERPDGRATHVECVDCHDPHRANGDPAPPGGIPGAIAGVSGLSSSGTPLAAVTRAHELCYKYHADDAASSADRIRRVPDQPNILRKFAPGNPSFHPVEGPGANPDVPSLKADFTTASLVTCTDCHNNDTGPGAGGLGPRGPHGSRWDYLLERRYDTRSPNVESSRAYELCYKCHARTSILNDDSFRGHRKHVVEMASPCSACHDPHGIDRNLVGATGDHTHLISFDADVVFPNSRGDLAFRDEGRFRGRCSLLCHGEDHDEVSYGS